MTIRVSKHVGQYRSLGLPIAWLGLCCLFLGCSRTVVGGFSDSMDKKYRLYGRVQGAYAHSYVEQTPKTVTISIVATDRGERLLFTKKYRLVGSDVSWNASWNMQDSVTVSIYDYGPGIGYSDSPGHGVPTNQLCTVSFCFDAKTGTFAEQTAGSAKQ